MWERKFISSSFIPYISFSIIIASLLIRCSVGQTASSSCGHQTIAPPFHLKGDPDFRGDPDFELTCTANTTLMMESSNRKYYVTNISYEVDSNLASEPFFLHPTGFIQMVDSNLASGRCTLPSTGFPSAYRVYRLFQPSRVYWFIQNWVSFVNCSKEIKEEEYRPVHCLSGNNTFVYLTFGNRVADLFPSCSFLSTVPSSDFTTFNSTVEVFQFLKKGFALSWEFPRFTTSNIIKLSLEEAFWIQRYEMQGRSTIFKWLSYPFLLEFYFLYGLTVFKHTHRISQSSYNFALVCIVFLDIAIVLLVIATLVRFVIAPLSMYVFLTYELRKIFVPIDTVEKFLRNHQTVMPIRYAYNDIIAITRHFKEKLGQGGFGSVYKGELPGGSLVAVKMLGNSKCNGEEFINEVSTIGMIHHINVVRLVGFCSDGSNRALVYEFMRNGSLDKYIFSSNGTNRKFTMEKLNEIALGVAKGIDYLHRGCDMRILHFDIKPHNILLDQNFNPKVSDFGLAKLYSKDYSHVSACAARGTIGYMTPELVSRSFGLISYKSDVYSFGMLLLEMAGGRRNVDPRVENYSQVYYPSWIYDQLDQTEGLEFCNGIEIDNVERKLCKVGLWCIQMRPSFRPTMSEVIEMLEGDVDRVDMPPKPFQFSSTPAANIQSTMDSSLTEISVIYENE